MENKDIFLLWAKSIDVQQHFNEIELKVRQLTLTVFTFIISGIGFMIKENKGVFSGIIPIEAIISAIGSIIIYAFFFMDKHWYHRLLKGAVGFSLKLEEKYPDIFQINSDSVVVSSGLTHEIGNSSPVKIFQLTKIHSDQKIIFFYTILISTLLFLSMLFICLSDDGNFFIKFISICAYLMVLCFQIRAVWLNK